MAKWSKLAVIFLVLAIIFSLVSVSTEYLSQCRRGPHVLFLNEDGNIECHKCYPCPPGTEISVNCDGHVVNNSVDIKCDKCVSGINYSPENDFQKCIKCPDMCKNQKTIGKCVADGDNRECVPCEKKQYFHKILKRCQFCSCRNMSAEARQVCSVSGFSFEGCRKPPPKPVNPALQEDKSDATGWNFIKIFPLVGGLVVAVLLLLLYLHSIFQKLCKFRSHKSRWPCRWELFQILCCFYAIPDSRSPDTAAGGDDDDDDDGDNDDRDQDHDDNQNGEQQFLAQPNPRPSLGRQNSATDYEIEDEEKCSTKAKLSEFLRKKYDPIKETNSMENLTLVNPRGQGKSMCKRKGVKVTKLNAEHCEKMYNSLNHAVYNKTGIGYVSLAGLMLYNSELVRKFESTDNPAKSLVEYWSIKRENDVVEFIELLKKMKTPRDDIIDDCLPSCNCCTCIQFDKL